MEDPPRKEAASVAPPRLYSSSDGTVTPPPTPSLSVGGSGLGIPPSAAAPLGAAAPSAAPVDVSALYDEAFRGSPRRATSLRSNGGGGGSSEDGSRSPPSGRAAAASAARRKLEFSDGDGGGAGATGAASSSDEEEKEQSFVKKSVFSLFSLSEGGTKTK